LNQGKQVNRMNIGLKSFLMAIVLVMIFTGCEKESTQPEDNLCNPSGVSGELLGSEFLITITPDQFQQYLGLAGAPITFTLDYSVDIHKLSYLTRDKNDELTAASGLFMLPRGIDTLDLASIQHGTIVERSNVGRSNVFSAFDAILLSMKGYAVAAPDYLGLGDSQGLHPYLHAELSASAVIDMLRSTRVYACENDINLSDELFLAGYSEGGFVTLATQRVMETQYPEEFTITAVAPMAGPYDLAGSTRNILLQERYDYPIFLTYLVVAYNDIYGWDRLDEIFNEPYASLLPSLFDGNSSSSEINAALPKAIDSLFVATFVESFLDGEELEVNAALLENSFEGWGPIAPVMLVHGTADSTVAFENSVWAQEKLIENGGVEVALVPIPGANHLTGAFTGFFIAQAWFESF